MKPTIDVPTVNLYGESNGIEIIVDGWGDIITDVEAARAELARGGFLVTVIGHALYACSLAEARVQIRDAYLDSLGGTPNDIEAQYAARPLPPEQA